MKKIIIILKQLLINSEEKSFNEKDFFNNIYE